MNYIANIDTIIFDSKFNDELDIGLISAYTKLIFSNFKLDKKIFECYENEKLFEFYSDDDLFSLKFLGSKFNQDVSNLPPSITHLIFGCHFNQDV